MRMMKASVYCVSHAPFPGHYSITWNLFTIDKESSSDEDSTIIEGDEAVESNDEPESEEPMDDFQKLEYWAKKHIKHYRKDFTWPYSGSILM